MITGQLLAWPGARSHSNIGVPKRWDKSAHQLIERWADPSKQMGNHLFRCTSVSPRGGAPAMLRCGMSLDVVDLRSFYVHPLGKVARRFVGVGIRRMWTGSKGLRVLGIGYSTPYLGLFREDAERCLAFMPATQGVMKWPTQRPTLAALVDEAELPLPDAAVDRILFVHALEMTHDAPALLREVWRVLAPGGRLLAVVPNRRGLWARMDTTPFGHGRPYSRSQITQLLRETWFTPTAWGEALYVPPIEQRWFLRSAVAWERTGATVSAPFAGVHLVEATKQVYRTLPARRKKLVPSLQPVLEPVLAPSPGGARSGLKSPLQAEADSQADQLDASFAGERGPCGPSSPSLLPWRRPATCRAGRGGGGGVDAAEIGRPAGWAS